MKHLLFTASLLFCLFEVLFATPTNLIVRARAKDAKFIGTGMGGAAVVIINTLTGEVLAKGITSGNSGNTNLLLQQSHSRYQSLTDTGTAKFAASIDISEPTFIEVRVTAPVTRKNASIKASTQLWIIPGKHIDGEGIIIEIPGYIIDILQPTTHEIIAAGSVVNNQVPLKSSVTMLCGCTITKGGIWDADRIEVAAIIKKDGKDFKTIKMVLGDKPNIFKAMTPVNGNGMYQVTIYAFDKVTGNTGVDQNNFVIQ
jgi:hypothetical protein